ncbi:hypothetical protein ACFLR1_00770 [Bacteroidota bacterium]
MKTIVSLILLVQVLWLAPAMGQNSFEGVVELSGTDKAGTLGSMLWYFKDGSSRIDISNNTKDGAYTVSFIVDSQGMDFIGFGRVVPVPKESIKPSGGKLTLLMQGAPVEVNGYECVPTVYSNGEGTVTYWFTDKSPLKFEDLPAVLLSNIPAVAVSSFPMKVEVKNGAGEIISSQEVIAINATSVDASRFERK